MESAYNFYFLTDLQVPGVSYLDWKPDEFLMYINPRVDSSFFFFFFAFLE